MQIKTKLGIFFIAASIAGAGLGVGLGLNHAINHKNELAAQEAAEFEVIASGDITGAKAWKTIDGVQFDKDFVPYIIKDEESYNSIWYQVAPNVRIPAPSVVYGDVPITSFFAIVDEAKLYAWGRNELGQLGLGHYNTVDTPQIVTKINTKNTGLDPAAGEVVVKNIRQILQTPIATYIVWPSYSDRDTLAPSANRYQISMTGSNSNRSAQNPNTAYFGGAIDATNGSTTSGVHDAASSDTYNSFRPMIVRWGDNPSSATYYGIGPAWSANTIGVSVYDNYQIAVIQGAMSRGYGWEPEQIRSNSLNIMGGASEQSFGGSTSASIRNVGAASKPYAGSTNIRYAPDTPLLTDVEEGRFVFTGGFGTSIIHEIDNQILEIFTLGSNAGGTLGSGMNEITGSNGKAASLDINKNVFQFQKSRLISVQPGLDANNNDYLQIMLREDDGRIGIYGTGKSSSTTNPFGMESPDSVTYFAYKKFGTIGGMNDTPEYITNINSSLIRATNVGEENIGGLYAFETLGAGVKVYGWGSMITRGLGIASTTEIQDVTSALIAGGGATSDNPKTLSMLYGTSTSPQVFYKNTDGSLEARIIPATVTDGPDANASIPTPNTITLDGNNFPKSSSLSYDAIPLKISQTQDQKVLLKTKRIKEILAEFSVYNAATNTYSITTPEQKAKFQEYFTLSISGAPNTIDNLDLTLTNVKVDESIGLLEFKISTDMRIVPGMLDSIPVGDISSTVEFTTTDTIETSPIAIEPNAFTQSASVASETVYSLYSQIGEPGSTGIGDGITKRPIFNQYFKPSVGVLLDSENFIDFTYDLNAVTGSGEIRFALDLFHGDKEFVVPVHNLTPIVFQQKPLDDPSAIPTVAEFVNQISTTTSSTATFNKYFKGNYTLKDGEGIKNVVIVDRFDAKGEVTVQFTIGDYNDVFAVKFDMFQKLAFTDVAINKNQTTTTLLNSLFTVNTTTIDKDAFFGLTSGTGKVMNVNIPAVTGFDASIISDVTYTNDFRGGNVRFNWTATIGSSVSSYERVIEGLVPIIPFDEITFNRNLSTFSSQTIDEFEIFLSSQSGQANEQLLSILMGSNYKVLIPPGATVKVIDVQVVNTHYINFGLSFSKVYDINGQIVDATPTIKRFSIDWSKYAQSQQNNSAEAVSLIASIGGFAFLSIIASVSAVAINAKKARLGKVRRK